jgi:RHS repeat-associated protein
MEYRWDIRDRLTGITVKNDLGEIIRTAEYTYDVYNQRIAKTVDTDGDGVAVAKTERYVYGPDQNIALVFDENGNVNHRYLFGDGVDEIEADESNGNVLWALTDHLGSVRDVVDDSGTVLNHVVYDAFGGVTSQTDESVVFRYGYTARELDAESGLQYNRARYLDSFTGKFISEDPISFQGGDSNLYRYVFNSPIRYSDPSGLFLEAGVSAAGAGAKAIGSGSGLLSGLALIGRFIAPVAAFATTFFAFTQPTADDDYFPSNPQASKNGDLRKSSPFKKPRTSNRYDNPSQMCTKDDEKEENRMKVQFQDKELGRQGTIETSRMNNSIIGVTSVQMVNAIKELETQNDSAGFPFPKREKAVYKLGVQYMIDFINKRTGPGGVGPGGGTIQTYQWDPGAVKGNHANNRQSLRGKLGRYRIDLENNEGINLRS